MECEAKILSNEYADGVIDFPIEELVNEGDDYCAVDVGFGFTNVYQNRKVASRLLESTYQYQYIPKVYGIMQRNEQEEQSRTSSPALFDSIALEESGILELQRAPLNLTGRGVLVIFLDTGIDYRNPVFLNAFGESRILAIWDQTIEGNVGIGRTPQGFGYGREYTREEINQALRSDNPYAVVPSRDENGHGTAMASVAVGSLLRGNVNYLGAAPEADILVVKLKECKEYLRDFYLLPRDVIAYGENDILAALAYANRYVEEFQRPGVFCLGFGSNQGDHGGNGFLDRYLDRLANLRSRCVVVCGGNEGASQHHAEGVLEEQEDVEIRVGEGERGFVMEFWGDTPAVYNITIRSPGGETVPPIRLEAERVEEYSFVFEETRIAVQSVLVEANSGSQLMVFRMENPTPGIWTFRVELVSVEGSGTFHMWLPIEQFLSGETFFTRPSPDITLTEPALAREVIGVSFYDPEEGGFGVDSGRGFSRGCNLKPDLCAPGVGEVTILGKRSGSSYAAALCAGASALFFQWAIIEQKMPLAQTKVVKNFMIRSAKRFPNINYPNREWGYGILRANDIFSILSRMGN